jgi:thiol-disulfide isomerase/thioredoxin
VRCRAVYVAVKQNTMRYLVLLLLFFISFNIKSQQVPVINYDELEQLWSGSSDTLYVVNFWATWCKPCIEELPDFYKVNDEFKGKAFKMILVSLDFPSHLESRVLPFIEKNKVKPKVVLLNDDDNVWINRVNPQWDGSIPVTLLIKNKKKQFHGTTLNYKELKTLVESKL